jgi:chromosome segregation ATPase
MGKKHRSQDASAEQKQEKSKKAAARMPHDQAKTAGRRAKGDNNLSITGGFAAFKSVRKANKSLATATQDLRRLKDMLSSDKELLAHREQVEADFPKIVAAQEAEMKTASADERRMGERIETLSAELGEKKAQLEELKADHERTLRPFRNLMDSSRGRADDAARKLADAKRALKLAENKLNDETKRRDQRIQAAHRDVDNAKERLRKVEAELDLLKKDPQALPGALEQTEDERKLEISHIESAQADVTRISKDCAAMVDAAQTELVSRQQQCDAAEREAANTKSEATSKKEEYERLYKQATQEEKQLEDQIKANEEASKEAKKSKDAATKRKEAAKKILDEAHEIHENPATTQGLKERIAHEEQDVAAKQAEVAELRRRAEDIKRRTRTSRIVVILICVAALAAVLALAFFLTRGGF